MAKLYLAYSYRYNTMPRPKVDAKRVLSTIGETIDLLPCTVIRVRAIEAEDKKKAIAEFKAWESSIKDVLEAQSNCLSG